MSSEAIAKRVKNIFILCLLAGICGLGESLINSLKYHQFMGIPIFPLLIIAEGIVFFLAFKEDTLEKAAMQLKVVKIFAIILAAYSLYSLVMFFVRFTSMYYGNLYFAIWYQVVHDFSAFFGSLAIFFSALFLEKKDVPKFNTSTRIILALEILFVFIMTAATIIAADAMVYVIAGFIIFILLFAVLPKLLGNSIVRGAIIGGIIAGDAGAVVGAVVAANKGKK